LENDYGNNNNNYKIIISANHVNLCNHVEKNNFINIIDKYKNNIE